MTCAKAQAIPIIIISFPPSSPGNHDVAPSRQARGTRQQQHNPARFARCDKEHAAPILPAAACHACPAPTSSLPITTRTFFTQTTSNMDDAAPPHIACALATSAKAKANVPGATPTKSSDFAAVSGAVDRHHRGSTFGSRYAVNRCNTPVEAP